MVRRLAQIQNHAARFQWGCEVIILTIAAFACTGLLIIWAMAKSASMRDEEEQRQRKAEALVKGGSLFK